MNNVTPQMNGSPWNSLETAKFVLEIIGLVVSTAIAVGLFFVSHRIDQARRDTEYQQKAIEVERSRQDKINEKKIALWDTMGPKLNSILAYVTYVGPWQSLRAADIVEQKRGADTLYYTYKPFFSKSFSKAYTEFMDSSFQMYNGFGEDAKVRTSPQFRPADKATAFANSYDLERTYMAYNALLEAAGNDFGLVSINGPYRNRAPVPVRETQTAQSSEPK